MKIGLACVILGVFVLLYPQILVFMFATLLITFGLGMMATAWQFRRLQRQSQSRFVNWLIRF